VHRQQDPRPAGDADDGGESERGQPEPKHQVYFLREEIDRQYALDRVRVRVAHLAQLEVAQGDAREGFLFAGHRRLPAAQVEIDDHSDAVQVVLAAEKEVEQEELRDDVAEIQELGDGVQPDEVVAESVAAQEAAKDARSAASDALLARVTR